MVSPQYRRYAAGSEKEKRAGGLLHGDTIAHLFVFCNGGLAGFFPDGWSCCGLRPPSAEGLVWPAPLSHPLHPPTFLETGGLAVPPAGAAPPAPCLGDGGDRTLPSLPTRDGGLGWGRVRSLIVCCFIGQPDLGVCRHEGVTKPLHRHYQPLQSHYESLLSRYGTVTSYYQSLRAVTELDGSKEPVPYNGIRSGPNLPRRVLPLGVFPQRSCHRGILCG